MGPSSSRRDQRLQRYSDGERRLFDIAIRRMGLSGRGRDVVRICNSMLAVRVVLEEEKTTKL